MLAAESEQLRRDNERLCRVIDSGDWGRQRVEELLQAGQVLQEERDALAKLVGSMQQQPQQQAGSLLAAPPPLHNATNSPSVAQQFRMPAAGMHPATGSAQPACLIAAKRPPGCTGAADGGGLQPASRPASPARNKLLVRSASSFNAMVRALKQDLLPSGALQRSPGAVYEVDKLSLHRLSVAAADGGDGAAMEVRAVGSPDRRGVAFGSSYPASPKHQLDVAAAGAAPVGLPAGDPARQSGSGLLAAALRLQGIGGRSVGLHRGSR